MDLALNRLQRLICHKAQPINQQKLQNSSLTIRDNLVSYLGHLFYFFNGFFFYPYSEDTENVFPASPTG